MRLISSLLLALLFVVPATAQQARVLTDDDWCDEKRNWNRDSERHCEVREISLDADRKVIRVDGNQNGGISVAGWDRNEILVRAKVTANARTESGARELADQVEIMTRGTIEADLPKTGERWGRSKEWTSVSYEIMVPVESNLDLRTHNGGVRIKSVHGDVEFDVLNGGVTLTDMAGDVEGSTTNGGVTVDLTGNSWDGDGLDVKTTNGGVKLRIPDNYSADLETGTVNGNVNIDFPVTVKGKIGRNISTKLGDGGQPIRVRTTNGGVKIQRS